MSNSKSSLFAAVLTAMGASFCCIVPFVAALAGITGGAGAFSFLEPARPYLGIFTASLLGFSFYNVYKKEKRHDCCLPADRHGEPEKKNFWKSKTFVWLIAVFAVLLYTFPYYSGIFAKAKPHSTNNTAITNKANIQTIDLKIEGMTCTGCENNVKAAVGGEEGVLECSVSYKNGNAIVKYNSQKISEEEIVNAVNETGYKVISSKIKN